MGHLDVRIQSKNPFRRFRKRRQQRLKCEKADRQSSAAASSSSHKVNVQILQSPQPTYNGQHMPDVLYHAAAMNDADAFLSALKRVSVDVKIDFFDILKIVTPSGNTLLHVAAINKCIPNVNLLLYHSPALILKQNLHGDTALHFAVRSGNIQLIHAFADFLIYMQRGKFREEWIYVVGTIPDIEKSVRVCNRYGNTPLHEAVNLEFYLAVTKFIQVDAEACYCINNEDKSPLYLAAEAGAVTPFRDMLQLLRHDKFKERSIEGLSPLLPAVLKRRIGIMDEIQKHEPAFTCLLDENGKTLLHYAASTGCYDMVLSILYKKVEYTLVMDKDGFLPIHTAAAHGNINVIQRLLQNGQEPSELLTHDGQNIFHVAAMRGNINVVSFVLKTSSLECLINEADIDGNTPLHLATLNWHAKVVFTMTWDKRVDLGCVNKEGFTPFDVGQHYMERPPSFDKRLTWTALKAAGAPESPPKETPRTNPSDPFGTQQSNTEDTNNYKDRVNTLLVVATLVATITFASGFTVPGGYDDSKSKSTKGMATMLRHTAFQIFILSDTIAMYSSILVAISLIWAQLGDINLVFIALRIAIPLLGVSLVTMSLAFMSGVYLVVSQLHWLACIVLITGSAFLGGSLLLFFPLCFPLASRSLLLRYFSYYPFLLLILVTEDNRCKSSPFLFKEWISISFKRLKSFLVKILEL